MIKHIFVTSVLRNGKIENGLQITALEAHESILEYEEPKNVCEIAMYSDGSFEVVTPHVRFRKA